VTLPEGVVAAIIEHAQREAPRECCGLLIGTVGRITESFAARNIAEDQTRRYLVDPRDHFSAIRLARHRGEDVIGVYHSHPRSRPLPSETDAAEGFPDFLYVIAGLAGDAPELTAWLWSDGNFTRTTLVRVP
jgi:proteasome lid subunit RPN8/RPN11